VGGFGCGVVWVLCGCVCVWVGLDVVWVLCGCGCGYGYHL